MTPVLYVVGLGPGNSEQVTAEARRALAGATDLLGYFPYVARAAALIEAGPDRSAPGESCPRGPNAHGYVPHAPVRHGSDNREELDRARHALTLALEGRLPVVVSGGDAGVFGMASAIFEAIDTGDPHWKTIDVRVIPGISAVLAASARLGAPLGGDFCVLSLSDNLKPWPVVARRLGLAAEAGLVIALYNPRSKSRPDQLDRAFALLRDILPPDTLIVFARAIGREGERVLSTTLAQARGEMADMSTLVMIGCAQTREIVRPGQESRIYTARSVS